MTLRGVRFPVADSDDPADAPGGGRGRTTGATETMSWQDFADDDEEQYDDDIPPITLGDLRDGDEVTITVDAEPETFVSDDYGEGVRVESTLEGSDYPFRDEDGDAIEQGDDVTLITWSRRLVGALKSYADDHGGIVGHTVVIVKYGSGYDTQYAVDATDDA